MFHVSFLIKENKARMILDEDNETSVPFIEPIKTKKADRDKPKSSAGGENAVLENRFQVNKTDICSFSPYPASNLTFDQL
jgi:hypothetical protein